MSYSVEQFREDIILFNKCCGGAIPHEQMTTDEVLAIVSRQIAIVNEEVLETIAAMSTNDMVEVLDGLVDVEYTLFWLEYVCNIAATLPNCPEMRPSQVGWLDVVERLMISCRLLFTRKVHLEAMRRIAENNNSKFTTDYSVAQQWVDGVDFEAVVSETVVDSITYYCIKDANGKIRKKACFVGVDLSDLV
jgi:hypothetical protein